MKHIKNALFGLAVVSTLGFGVASATAQVGEAKADSICPFVRTPIECTDCCSAYNWVGIFTDGKCDCV